MEVPEGYSYKLGYTPTYQPAIYFDKEDYTHVEILQDGNYKPISVIEDITHEQIKLLMGSITKTLSPVTDFKAFVETHSLTPNTLLIEKLGVWS